MDISIGALILVLGTAGTDDQIQTLQKLVHELREEVSELKNDKKTDWLTKQRVEEIRMLVHDVLLDADKRASMSGNVLLAGYDGGAFITSADGNWSLKINGQLQSRWMYNKASDQNLLAPPLQNTQHGFELRRTKVRFSGYVIDPSWKYKLTTTWGRGGGSNTEDAYIQKTFEDGAWFKFGQFKSNFLRENIISSSKQLATERTMLNNAFTYGWTQGVEFGWRGDDTKLLVQYTDGPNQSNTPALQDPTNAWIIRVESRIGEAGWNDFDFLTSQNDSKTGLLLGVAYQNFDIDTSDNTNNIEYGNANAFSSSGWTLDASWRGDGWNAFGYYVTSTSKGFNDVGEQHSDGWLMQAGFMANDNLEIFGQYQKGTINNATWLDGSNDMNAIRVGFNYWPISGNNAVKWTTDVAWAGKSLAAGTANTSNSGIAVADWDSTGNGWRRDQGTNDDQMLLRTQMQLLF